MKEITLDEFREFIFDNDLKSFDYSVIAYCDNGLFLDAPEKHPSAYLFYLGSNIEILKMLMTSKTEEEKVEFLNSELLYDIDDNFGRVYPLKFVVGK
ncbi:MAG: hypothetical protein CMI54_01695 [Parcubacteria group bacterium]|nr:hypothetical protein [Parcubacteria group bacterium]|tara:strand:- start:18281 stop:18571 length:291 start_codon:yes stop_codon:yes gene_type:complete